MSARRKFWSICQAASLSDRNIDSVKVEAFVCVFEFYQSGTEYVADVKVSGNFSAFEARCCFYL